MKDIEDRIIVLNGKINSRSEEEQRKYSEEFKVILSDNQYCILYGVLEFLDQPIGQVLFAGETLYREMFEQNAEA